MIRTLAILACMLPLSTAAADSKNGRLDIYFIDVEGGAATLLVSPQGESILIDSGYPDNHGRDKDRIIKVATEVAGLSKIDHAMVSHWHRDHYGNHAVLAAELGIGTFWDRGIPESLQEDDQFETRVAAYRAATQNASRKLTVGDRVPFRSGKTEFKATVLAASREVISNKGPANPYADRHEPRERDASDNAASLAVVFEFGEFRFLCCGDLTWNVEGQLVTPNNPVGTVDMYMVTHHGLPTSNNPALVLAVDPTVTVMCNGPTKGGAESTLKTLHEVKSLQDMYQLHRNVALDPTMQAPPEFIANSGTTEICQGKWIKASVAPDGGSYTVQIGPDGQLKTYQTRDRK